MFITHAAVWRGINKPRRELNHRLCKVLSVEAQLATTLWLGIANVNELGAVSNVASLKF